jgi:hypothetical protein
VKIFPPKRAAVPAGGLRVGEGPVRELTLLVTDAGLRHKRKSRHEQSREAATALRRGRRCLCRPLQGRIVTKHKHHDGTEDSAD